MQTNLGNYLYDLLDGGMTATEIVKELSEQARKYEADQKKVKEEELALYRSDVVDALFNYVCELGIYDINEMTNDEIENFYKRTEKILKKTENEILTELREVKAAATQKKEGTPKAKTEKKSTPTLTPDEIKILKFLNSIM